MLTLLLVLLVLLSLHSQALTTVGNRRLEWYKTVSVA